MPTYEYLCEANGRIVEVSHKMAQRLGTWGELCRRAEIAPGATAANEPITKLISGSFVNTSGASANQSAAACESGMPCCGGGMCQTYESY